MDKPKKQIEWLVWGGLGVTMAVIVAAFVVSQRAASTLPVLYQVPDFTLTNQNNHAVTLADLRGQVWLADIVFTRCAGPCPEMTRKMSALQAALPAGKPLKFVTLTTDPEFDTPAVLAAYGQRHGASPGRWWFLTGTKPHIARLAGDGLKLAAVEKKPEERTNDMDMFIHSTIFVLVDKQARVRGIFESDQPEAHERIVAAVKQLLREK